MTRLSAAKQALSDAFLWSLEGRKFCRRFAWLNRLWHHWPVQIAWDEELGLYRVWDSTDSIYVSKPRRFVLYRKGVNERLRALAEEYLVNQVSLQSSDLVIDCGANVGELSVFLKRTRGVHVVAFEPDPGEFKALYQNLSGIGAHARNEALWKRCETLTLHLRNDTGDSSVFHSSAGDDTVTVNATTLDHVIASFPMEQHIALLKLEAEGAEPEILEGAEQTLPRIHYITADLGPERGEAGESTLSACVDFLTRREFEVVDNNTQRCVVLFRNLRFPKPEKSHAR